ncbi:MAG: hypothetical protein M1820_005120 [Bogoriella megaspora]|nr:MAG: hypothetical protein M1820_005120 [Bogoriella megaspora]
MTDSKQATTPLLTEHFRYTPITLLDDIINTVNELVYRAVNAIEEGLLSAPPRILGFERRAKDENRILHTDTEGSNTYPEAKAEIEEGVHQLETLLEATVDRNFDKLEIWSLRNVLAVPGELASWIRLEHYKDHNFSTNSGFPSTENIYILRRKLQETQKLNRALSAESQRNSILIQQIKSLLQPSDIKTSNHHSSGHSGSAPNPTYLKTPLTFLTNSAACKYLGISARPSQDITGNALPLLTHTDFTLSQISALTSHLEQLEQQSTSSPRARIDGTALETMAEERRTYVESRTRRVMEANGIDLQANGCATSKASCEELRALERIVNNIERPIDGENTKS